MKVLKIVLPIVVVIVFIGSSVALGRLHSNSLETTTTIPPGLDESNYSIPMTPSATSSYNSSGFSGSAISNVSPLSKGIPIATDSPSKCRSLLMRGIIERYAVYENDVSVDRFDKLRGRMTVHNDGNVESPRLAKKLNIPSEEVVVDLWEHGLSDPEYGSATSKFRYLFDGKDIPMQSATGTVYRFVGIDNPTCTIHFEQFQWDPSYSSKFSPDDLVEFGDHVRQFPN